MKASLVLATGLALAALSGCGSSTGTLKGKVVDNGAPVKPDGLASLSFYPMKDGTPDANNSFTAVLNGDGTFDVVASGGKLPPGTYRVVVASAGGAGREGGGPGPEGFPKAGKEKADRFAPHNTLATSKLSVTVAAGSNDVVIDLSKAGG
jgi:hypothetical protein